LTSDTHWDIDDASSDVYLKAAISVARALSTRAVLDKEGQAVDFDEIDRAILDIEKQVNGLADISKWGGTIKSNAEKIIDKARIISDKLTSKVKVLDDRIEDLKHLSEEAL